MKKILSSLPVRLIIGVVIGIIIGLGSADLWIGGTDVGGTIMQVVLTLKNLLGSLINFCVPLIIIGFIAPSITRLRSNASRMLVLALALAYMQFRKGQPGLISSVFIPLIGEKRARGWLGKTVDVLSVFATAAGVATSLGLGILQFNAGLHFLTGLPETALVQLFLILFLAAVYILTAVVGIEKGMNTVSKLNIRFSMTLYGFIP